MFYLKNAKHDTFALKILSLPCGGGWQNFFLPFSTLCVAEEFNSPSYIADDVCR